MLDEDLLEKSSAELDDCTTATDEVDIGLSKGFLGPLLGRKRFLVVVTDETEDDVSSDDVDDFDFSSAMSSAVVVAVFTLVTVALGLLLVFVVGATETDDDESDSMLDNTAAEGVLIATLLALGLSVNKLLLDDSCDGKCFEIALASLEELLLSKELRGSDKVEIAELSLSIKLSLSDKLTV